mmetsp:Transcript_26387/g.43124  ORF Transcript_26387/g.43124 Transcript_26387/m.43124 type:complete len:372 (-) Transcript_26387:98-1213(-)
MGPKLLQMASSPFGVLCQPGGGVLVSLFHHLDEPVEADPLRTQPAVEGHAPVEGLQPAAEAQPVAQPAQVAQPADFAVQRRQPQHAQRHAQQPLADELHVVPIDLVAGVEQQLGGVEAELGGELLGLRVRQVGPQAHLVHELPQRVRLLLPGEEEAAVVLDVAHHAGLVLLQQVQRGPQLRLGQVGVLLALRAVALQLRQLLVAEGHEVGDLLQLARQQRLLGLGGGAGAAPSLPVLGAAAAAALLGVLALVVAQLVLRLLLHHRLAEGVERPSLQRLGRVEAGVAGLAPLLHVLDEPVQEQGRAPPVLEPVLLHLRVLLLPALLADGVEGLQQVVGQVVPLGPAGREVRPREQRHLRHASAQYLHLDVVQ